MQGKFDILYFIDLLNRVLACVSLMIELNEIK